MKKNLILMSALFAGSMIVNSGFGGRDDLTSAEQNIHENFLEPIDVDSIIENATSVIDLPKNLLETMPSDFHESFGNINIKVMKANNNVAIWIDPNSKIYDNVVILRSSSSVTYDKDNKIVSESHEHHVYASKTTSPLTFLKDNEIESESHEHHVYTSNTAPLTFLKDFFSNLFCFTK